MKASAKVPGIAEDSLDAELTEDPKIADPALSDLLRSFDRADRRLLLVLDEAQVLAARSFWFGSFAARRIRCSQNRQSRSSSRAAPRALCGGCLVAPASGGQQLAKIDDLRKKLTANYFSPARDLAMGRGQGVDTMDPFSKSVTRNESLEWIFRAP